MLKPTVFQIILNTTFKFFWVIVANQDRNKGIQGIKSFLEKKKDKDTVIVKGYIGPRAHQAVLWPHTLLKVISLLFLVRLLLVACVCGCSGNCVLC